MVILNRIYTRTGDGGDTAIGDGSRVSKLNQRVITGGAIDEINCQIGVAAAGCEDDSLVPLLHRLQQQLFDLGADVTCPWNPTDKDDRCPRIAEHHVTHLENDIDEANKRLQPLNSFVLPGGSTAAAALHLARSVCRRAELDALRLQLETDVNPQITVYLNRLSDLLFVLARCANANGQRDVLWTPDSGTDSA